LTPRQNCTPINNHPLRVELGRRSDVTAPRADIIEAIKQVLSVREARSKPPLTLLVVLPS
jgi:hypothetical protein